MSTLVGSLLFLSNCLEYERYFADPANMHVQERVRYAIALAAVWHAAFFGSVLFGLVSLFGLSWWRWTGVCANLAAFLMATMILGALCGPFGCG